ncbi:[protein-PII] uridylyltransferase [Zoogloea sp.]|uniref:[protein-PII] uridylyltransferase n=1 Tax=Zoogloea sp. TaxID=49181 RepID=UPI00262AAC26|nr:[protein-PII] uridylyltransferase [Zoogloea sp.]MDD3354403.1 [protein-PII] uridylyltransferase [Zoogloea sp.]
MPAAHLPPALEANRELIAHHKASLKAGADALRRAYEARPLTDPILRGRCQLVDSVLTSLWKASAIPSSASLVAVGGYGRGDLFPHSDVDLLFLLEDDPDEELSERLTQLIGLLWDVGLEIGHSVRTIDGCLEEAEQDITVMTNLLEARLIHGNTPLFKRFQERLHGQLNPGQFFKAKRLEQEQRYTRHNDTPYSLEPNCKESPGGLRDLQLIGWISRAAGLGTHWRDLARHGLITEEEAIELRELERFLQHVRIRLHHLTRRREDRLLFDHQETLAHEFGFTATDNRRASEVFMQEYYRTAKKVTQLNTILLLNFGVEFFPNRYPAAININERFQCVRELLDVRDEGVFDRHPSALLECFLLLQQRSELKGMTARTLRALWRGRKLINTEFRQNPANRALFLRLLQQKRGIVHEMRRMNQYGILSFYLPAWRRIVGQMQHDLFHVYTVDQHILQVLRNVRRLMVADHAHEYPLLTRLCTSFEKPWLIYIAAIFHDIAKGRGGDHSRLGMKDARDFCENHGLGEEDTRLVVWLVQHHLSMSNVAQKQDLSDLDVIQRFAGLVGNERYLTALYILTHADIRGTSPKVWNGWKGKLLEDLFFATQRLLRGATPQQALGTPVRQDDARSLLRYYGLRPGTEDALWAQLDQVYFLRHDPEEIAWHARMLYYRVESDEPLVKARLSQVGEGLQVMVYMRDAGDLFVRLCGFFSRLGFSIADAKIHTTRHGYALDSFVLLDPGHEIHYRDMINLLEHDLTERLQANAPVDRPAAGRLSREVKHFPITPEVSIRPDERGQHYIMSVIAADRPGLLFGVAETLVAHGINLHTAKIATLGERAEDTFLISGPELSQDARILKIETDLLEKLAI